MMVVWGLWSGELHAQWWAAVSRHVQNGSWWEWQGVDCGSAGWAMCDVGVILVVWMCRVLGALATCLYLKSCRRIWCAGCGKVCTLVYACAGREVL